MEQLREPIFYPNDSIPVFSDNYDIPQSVDLTLKRIKRMLIDMGKAINDANDPERGFLLAAEKIRKENKILEQLKGEALYVQRSFSTELLYETYGGAKMARQLGAITQSEFVELYKQSRRTICYA